MGGTPPPFKDKILAKKKLRIWGVPPPPLFGQNFLQKVSWGFGGYPPHPLYGQNPQISIWRPPLDQIETFKPKCVTDWMALDWIWTTWLFEHRLGVA